MAERLITLNIRRYLVKQPRTKRARRAMRYIRERISHYTKIDPEKVKIGEDVNNAVFKHYAKYMTPIKLRVLLGTDTADVLMFKEGESANTKVTDAKAKDVKETKVAETKKNKVEDKALREKKEQKVENNKK